MICLEGEMTTRLENSEFQMVETTGTLNLKIAQLERRLQLLRKQQLLSQAYPIHQARLFEEGFRVQRQTQSPNPIADYCRLNYGEVVQ